MSSSEMGPISLGWQAVRDHTGLLVTLPTTVLAVAILFERLTGGDHASPSRFARSN